jgi:hypothetical protein
MKSASATAVPFTIATDAPTTRNERGSYTASALKFGTLIFLLGSAPGIALETAPTAARSPLPVVEALIERRDSYRRSHAVERGLARLKLFAKYQDDWDGNGAQAANDELIDEASQYLTVLEPWHPSPLTTLSSLGEPIIEFEESDTGFFGSLRFLADREVELYAKYEGKPSSYLVGSIDSSEVERFMLDTMKLPTLQ